MFYPTGKALLIGVTPDRVCSCGCTNGNGSGNGDCVCAGQTGGGAS